MDVTLYSVQLYDCWRICFPTAFTWLTLSMFTSLLIVSTLQLVLFSLCLCSTVCAILIFFPNWESFWEKWAGSSFDLVGKKPSHRRDGTWVSRQLDFLLRETGCRPGRTMGRKLEKIHADQSQDGLIEIVFCLHLLIQTCVLSLQTF